MDIETRTRAAYAAAVGAFLELADTGQASDASAWIGLGFPRGDTPALAQAQLLLVALDGGDMPAEGLFNTAAVAFGGKMGGFAREPLARRVAFEVFRAVARALPKDEPVVQGSPDVSFRMVQMQPRSLFRTVRGIDMSANAPPEPATSPIVSAPRKGR